MAFEAVARHGSKVQAARELNVTPAAISKQLRQLEEWIGAVLLDEKSLTRQGRTLAQSLSSGLDIISAGVAVLRPSHAGSELALLAPATLALRWLMPHLPGLGADTAARLLMRPTHTGEDWLSIPHDIVLRRDSWVPQGYRAEALGVERLTIAVAPGLAGPAGEAPSDLIRRVPQLRAALAGKGWVLAPVLALAADQARGHLVMPFPEMTIEGPRLALLSRAKRSEQENTAPVRAWLCAEFAASSK